MRIAVTLGAIALTVAALFAAGLRGALAQTSPATAPAAVTSPTSMPTTSPSRLPPRAMLGDAEYEAQADALRAAYSKPPAEWPKAEIDAGVEFREIGLLPEVPAPADNPVTPEKIELGKQLFFDPRLSGSGQIACASCHDPDLAWADGRTLSFGHGRTALKRNAPGLTVAGHQTAFFWDGRADSLEEQAAMPIFDHNEMRGGEEGDVLRRLAEQAEYRRRFAAAFCDEQVTMDRVAKSLATFQRSIRAGRSRLDAFLKGNEHALDDEAVRGLHLFRTTARCMNCHNGPALTDDQFHNLGLSYYGRKLEDLGRYEITGKPEDVGAFKTPSLRNVARTGPYMHNGVFDLPGVLNMYNAGMPTLRRKPEQMDDPLFPTKSPLLKPLGLNRRDLLDLLAFLDALSEPRLRVRPPALPGMSGAAQDWVDDSGGRPETE